ncbi:MAG: 4,5-DOPA dioxygenase extradiol [Deltaproteobacteria bacterium]|nr:4,5-DOPA dioxygenase extradiol [Deltaproteobacteria bacterium]
MQKSNQLCPVLFIPHGGGPLPLLGDQNHQTMVSFLKEIAPTLGTPSTILIISAHWEEEIVSITSAKRPSLIYDYYGFPEESYAIEYPAAGDPELAEKIYWLLRDDGIEAKLDDSRGFDHGVFVPLKIMFPEANIPCVQLSLLNSLSAESHLQIGKALSELRHENMLVIGSGFSFHNMKALMSQSKSGDNKNEEFERWLIDTCTNPYLLPTERDTRLIEWTNAPFARYCHPREEHLLPLHVCMGMTECAAKLVFEGIVAGKKTSSFLWN